jgi:hypothetical protein
MRFSLIGSGLCALAVIALAAPANADPTVIDFSGTPGGVFLSYTESGATFTATDGLGLTSENFGPAPGGSRALIGGGFPLSTIRADFSGLATFVSVDLGDFNADDDGLFLEAYDSSNNLLTSSILLIPASFTGMETLSLNAVDIAYVIFGSRAPSFNGESNVYADNFTFDATGGTADVPEPGTFAMLAGAGVVGLGLIRRRK